MNLFGLEIRRAPGGLSPVVDNRGGWWPVIREPFSGAWQRNQEWTTDTVLAHHAVYACITRIAQDIGKLRPKLVERDTNGIWTEVENTAHSPALRQPNRFQNHIQFKESWAISKLTRGNTYVLIERDNRGVPSAFYVLDPARVRVLVAPDGAVFYQLQTDNLAGLEQDQLAVPASEIVHDRMNCLYHPLVGTSPIFACGTAANMGLQIQQNSSAFFGNGSNPSGILSGPMQITKEKAIELSDIWNAQYGKDKSGGVAVLGNGLTFTQMRMTAVDSQTIEQLKWTAETVCSTFHVPPWKVGIGPQPAYTKPEIANQAYYSDCLQSPIEQWELCMDQAFGFTTTTEGRWLGVELDLDGLLRMDVAGQYDTMVKAAGGAVLTPDEARQKMDQPPLPGGHTLYRQQQEFSLEALAKRDQLDNPFAPAGATRVLKVVRDDATGKMAGVERTGPDGRTEFDRIEEAAPSTRAALPATVVAPVPPAPDVEAIVEAAVTRAVAAERETLRAALPAPGTDVRAVIREEVAAHQRTAYRGVWEPSAHYDQGQFVTFGGSLWNCQRPCTGEHTKPGTSDSWVLCVKRGADGRDRNR